MYWTLEFSVRIRSIEQIKCLSILRTHLEWLVRVSIVSEVVLAGRCFLINRLDYGRAEVSYSLSLLELAFLITRSLICITSLVIQVLKSTLGGRTEVPHHARAYLGASDGRLDFAFDHHI